MPELMRPMIMMSIILLLIIVPFLLFERSIDQWWAAQKESPPSRAALSLLVVGSLAGDNNLIELAMFVAIALPVLLVTILRYGFPLPN